MTKNISDIIVIGGGLHGLSAGLNLARAGRSVVILEQAWVGRHASGSSAAGVRTLNRALEELPISFESMDMWHNIKEIVGDDCGFHAHGQLQVAENSSDVNVLEKRLEESRSAGFNHEELINQAELQRLVPEISKHCIAALIVRQDGAADPHRTLMSFRQSSEEAGVVIHEGCGVSAIERIGSDWLVRAGKTEFTAPIIVNTAGAWAGNIASMIGDDIPFGYKASMMMVTERITNFIKPVISVVGRPLSFKQTQQGTLVIGGGLQGTANLETQKSYVDFIELSKSAQAVTELFPSIAPLRIVRTWTGIEAKTRDLLPVIGLSPNASGVYHAFGFSGHGFQLVPIVGAILTDLIIRGTTDRQITDFTAERLMKLRVAS